MTSSIPMFSLLAQLNGQVWKPAGVCVTIDGTVYPGFPGPPIPGISGFSSDIPFGLSQVADGLWAQFCVAYEAQTFPMQPSINQGEKNTLAAILGGTDSYGNTWPGYPVGTKLILSGYSQGAIVMNQIWVNHCLNPGGLMYDRYQNGDIQRIYQFGDPNRSPNLAYGSAGTPVGMPPNLDGQVTGGIAGPGKASQGILPCLTAAQTEVPSPYDGKPVIYSFANKGDLYSDCPVGMNPWSGEAAAGTVESRVMWFILTESVVDLAAWALDIGAPIGTIEAILNGLVFFVQGPGAPHYHYEDSVPFAVEDALNIGLSLPHISPLA